MKRIHLNFTEYGFRRCLIYTFHEPSKSMAKKAGTFYSPILLYYHSKQTHTIFEIKWITSGICLFDLLAGPVDKHFIVHIGLNGQT